MSNGDTNMALRQGCGLAVCGRLDLCEVSRRYTSAEIFPPVRGIIRPVVDSWSPIATGRLGTPAPAPRMSEPSAA
jgi:hypothetical protein